MSRILVVDDDAALRGVVRMALEGEGYEVLEAGDGAEAVQMAWAQPPDLILCDVRMENMDGYRTLEALRGNSLTASLPFILMTGQADQAGMRQGMELGADDYLSKPFTVNQLSAAVGARLKKQKLVREHAERKLADLRENISLALPHELLTPLNGILGFSEILISDHASVSPEEIESMAEAIRDSAQRLHRVIENFLVFVQLELRQAGHAGVVAEGRPLNLRPVTAEAVERVAATAQRGQDLVLEVEDAPAAILADYWAKIVSELLDNAFKFSEPGTPVRVSLKVDTEHCLLTLADQGRGMKPEHIAQVGAYMQFERRFHEQQGSGLGLAIAKRLTELHGGSLNISSPPGQGTTVEVRLRRASPDGASAP
jgi:signal transduction histidine kinase